MGLQTPSNHANSSTCQEFKFILDPKILLPLTTCKHSRRPVSSTDIKKPGQSLKGTGSFASKKTRLIQGSYDPTPYVVPSSLTPTAADYNNTSLPTA